MLKNVFNYDLFFFHELGICLWTLTSWGKLPSSIPYMNQCVHQHGKSFHTWYNKGSYKKWQKRKMTVTEERALWPNLRFFWCFQFYIFVSSSSGLHLGRDIFYRWGCSNLTRQPYKLSSTLKRQASATSSFPKSRSYHIFFTAHSGSLPPQLSPLPNLGKQCFRFYPHSNTVFLLHCYPRSEPQLLSEKDPKVMFFCFCPSSPSAVPPTLVSSICFTERQHGLPKVHEGGRDSNTN